MLNWRRISLLLFITALPVFIGLEARFNDLEIWQKRAHSCFYEKKPLFTSYDAFLFARYAKEEACGKYKAEARDNIRFVPDNLLTNNVTYPSPIPLESWITAKLMNLTNTSIEWIALYLTPIFAVFFVIPFSLYFYRIGLPLTGLAGSIVGVISLIYVIRTSIVRFDTDSLNLFFPFLIAFLLHTAIDFKSKKRYLTLATTGIVSYLYYWWYGHPGIILVIFAFFTFLELFLYKIELNQVLKDIGLLSLFSNPLVLVNGIFNLIASTKTYLINYFKPAVEGGFPNVLMSISEAKHFDLDKLSVLTAGNKWVFFVGIAGIIVLVLRKWKDAFLLLPVLLIGLMALKGGNRFAMYLAPFVGAGFGYLFEAGLESLKENKKRLLLYAFSFLIVPAILIYSNRNSIKFSITPKITPALAGDFEKLTRLTPSNSWIWTWWDYGYAIQYYAGRGVYHDGGSQGSPKTYFVATSFSTDKPEVARNVILGISNIGATGIKKLLKEGKRPEEIRSLIFSGAYSKPVRNPVYWAFTGDEVGKFAWINYFGTWDFKRKKGKWSPIFELGNCRVVSKNVIACGVKVLDLNKGVLILPNREIPLKALILKDRDKEKKAEKSYHDKGLYLEIIRKGTRDYLYLVPPQAFPSMFNQMYLLKNFDNRYFELIYDDFPTMVLYKVKETGIKEKG